MTQIEIAKNNKYSPEVKVISKYERLNLETLRQRVSRGRIVIPHNKKRKIVKPCGIGEGLTTKINANLGTSPFRQSIKDELKKLEIAIRYGADTVMDLSTGGDLNKIREEIIKHSSVPVGTVPIYEAAVNVQKKYGSFLNMDAEEMFEVLEKQAVDGVDFFTIHAGVTQKNLSFLWKKSKRIAGIVSRGGAILACWMRKHKRENPFFEYFDRVLDIAHRYDITLSLGDGLRPGSIFDANDKAQDSELSTLGELTKLAWKKSVQIMIEGPGHVRLDKIKENVLLEKKVCGGAPFYVLGPLVTDIASGYDHISSAIGGAIAASYGADFLCFVTPSEHLRLPSIEDVREGVIASRIAAHSSDLVKGIKSALDWDRDMSIARRKRNWQSQIKLSLDPEKATRYYGTRKKSLNDVCSMCGKYCAIKLSESALKNRDVSSANRRSVPKR
ncbi:MAG: phosphomethylpyrimidine synthase [Omnitrophica WOR_2 bacterium SM23_29]|nr:MAG: phosphomethylpyrimidine synthase [Omnitrophica WOR_2 bacterium SM23_29]